MGFLSTLKSGFSSIKEGLANEVTKIKTKDQAHAVMAVIALSAGSSGGVSSQERKAGGDFMRRSDLFQAFDRAALASTLEGYYAKAVDPLLKEDLYYVIRKVKGTPAAPSVVRVGIGIASGDDDFDAAEKAEMREVCAVLGLNPADFKGLG